MKSTAPAVIDRDEYVAHLNSYVSEKNPGHFERPMNIIVYDVLEWMEYHEVVANDARILLGLSLLFPLVCLLGPGLLFAL